MPLYYAVVPRSQGGTGVSTTPAAPVSYGPANPTGTASTTQVMMGFGSTCLLTPASSGTVLVTIGGTAKTATSQAVVTVGARYGPSAGPATTVAAASNGGEISAVASWSAPSAGVLAVASTTGWTATGTLYVAASGSTVGQVTYTGISGNTFTGCAYVAGSATGTVATSGAVTGAPQNSSPVVGTRFGPAADVAVSGSGAGSFSGYAVTAVVSLAAGTAYWFDLGVATGNASDSASVAAVTMALAEMS